MHPKTTRKIRRGVAAAAVAITVTGAANAVAGPAAASPSGHKLNAGAGQLTRTNATGSARSALPAGVPDSGRYAFLLRLSTNSTGRAFALNRRVSLQAAKTAARSQLSRVADAQDAVIAELPSRTPVLYRMHSLMAGVAVTSNVANYETLRAIPGVSAVYPIAPKSAGNSYAVPLQGAPQVWEGQGDLGRNTSIGIIDTGIDYTHANLGGSGDLADWTSAHTNETTVNPSLFPTDKVIGGYDFVGDGYDAGGTGAALVPNPDANPIDCNGHGSHVAGTAAGYGENADGTTYTGAYNQSTPFDTMKIGPGMAPEAKLYAFKVFGCVGSTNVVAEALDRAADPNGDGDTSDHVDVVNMSLGSDFGSPEDGDSVASDIAVDQGIEVAVASGNGGDYTDIGGSPGDASKVITVANSQDAQSVIDGVKISIDGGPDTTYGATRAVKYDWSTMPDLTGNVVAAPADDANACQPFSSADAATISGQVVLTEWNEDNLACGSITAGKNLRNAGAVGFIFANIHETFSAGINGDTVIPGVLVVKSGADAIQAALAAGTPVTVDGTSVNAVKQTFPADNDKINDSSSRGIHAASDVKPDVTAVGTSVFSTAVGTGTDGESLTGTSMATPMVAGLSALVVSAHPDWTPEQVKADIMNTAGQDIYTNGSAAADKGFTYAPNRVGAGRIEAVPALANQVLAYNADDPGSVSVSFGPVQATAPMELTKKIKVQNTGLSRVTYDLSYDAITSVPGTEYSVFPERLTLDPRSSAVATVTFSVNSVRRMTKTVDPTFGRTSAYGYPKETLSDASGRLLFTDVSGDRPQLRVPVYAAPRPASTMTQAGSLTLSSGAAQTGTLALTGGDLGASTGANGVGDGNDVNDIVSLAAGFELAATSGRSPECSDTVTVACYRLPEERDADIKDVGVTTDAQLHGGNPAASQAYFAISTYQPWSIPASKEVFQVDLDTNGDGLPDLYLYNTRLGKEDLFVSELYDPKKGVIDDELINNRFGDVDTALYDSDTLMLPLYLNAIAPYLAAGQTRIGYGVESYSAYSAQPIDLVGVDASTGQVGMSMDLFTPGVQVTDSTGGAPLVADSNGADLTVTRNVAAYKADNGQGLLMVHFHNLTGDKAQVVSLKSTPTVDLAVTPTTVKRGRAVTATVTVTDPDGLATPTGDVTLTNVTTGTPIGTKALDGTGTATFSYTPTALGTLTLSASYAGDANYVAADSDQQQVTVEKSTPTVDLAVTPTTVARGSAVSATVTVTGADGLPTPTGDVTLTDVGTGTAIATEALDGTGTATFSYTPTALGTLTLSASYAGDDYYVAADSNQQQVTVEKSTPTVDLAVTPTTVARGDAVTATVTVTHPDGLPMPTGDVTLTDVGTGAPIATEALDGTGTATFSYTPTTPGTLTLGASYAGDDYYVTADSNQQQVTVQKSAAKVRYTLAPRPGDHTQLTTATVTVATVLGVPATGTVKLWRVTGPNSPRLVVKGTLSGGKATLQFKPLAGTYDYQVFYLGDANYDRGQSGVQGYHAS